MIFDASVKKPLWAVVIGAAALAVLVALICLLCGGHFMYTLDDPYISLALAEHMLHGTFGINAGVPASPTSSALEPWVLAGGLWLHLGHWTQFLQNAVAALLSVFIGMRMLVRFGYVTDKTPLPVWLGWALLVLLATSALALPLTGLEHSWHVLCCLVVFEGIVQASQKQKPGISVWICLGLLPLVRFEGIGMCLVALFLMFRMGYRRQSVVVALLLCLIAAGYAGFMHANGLPPLPGPVLIKSSLAASAYGGGDIFGPVLHNVFSGLGSAYGRGFMLTCILLFLVWRFSKNTKTSDKYVYVFVIAAVLLHVLCGTNGVFFRYEVYIFAVSVFALLYLYREEIQRYLKRGRVYVRAFVLCALCLVGPYALAAVETPFASADIYRQQYQMRRFAQDYLKAPVAVNDLGLVAYQNPNFVLDMVGLGSEKVRRLRALGQYDTAALSGLIRAHHIGFAMLYDRWFSADGFSQLRGILPKSWTKVAMLYYRWFIAVHFSQLRGGLPKSWTKVAVLHCSYHVTSWGSEVSFYVTGRVVSAAILEKLKAFQKTLPDGVWLQILPVAHPAT